MARSVTFGCPPVFLMGDSPGLPRASDFPPGTEFVIKEFDVPLARVPGEEWFNWFGGRPRSCDERSLHVDNNWPAESLEEWVGLVEATVDKRDRFGGFVLPLPLLVESSSSPPLSGSRCSTGGGEAHG
jgi:hypothetical protein